MKEQTSFSTRIYAEPVKEMFTADKSGLGVIRRWRKRIEDEISTELLQDKKVKFFFHFEVPEDDMRSQLREEMKATDKHIRSWQINEFIEALILYLKNLIDFKDVYQKQAEMDEYESEHPLVAYVPLCQNVIDSLLNFAEKILNPDQLEFLTNFITENNEDWMGIMNLKKVYDFEIVDI